MSSDAHALLAAVHARRDKISTHPDWLRAHKCLEAIDDELYLTSQEYADECEHNTNIALLYSAAVLDHLDEETGSVKTGASNRTARTATRNARSARRPAMLT
jgi:hypothetical protein